MTNEKRLNIKMYITVFMLTVLVCTYFLLSASENEQNNNVEHTYEMTDHNLKNQSDDNNRTHEQDQKTVVAFTSR